MYLFMIFSCISLQILLIYWVFTINRRIYPAMADQCRYYLIIHLCVSYSPGLILIYLTPLLRWLLVCCLTPSTTPDHGGYHIYNILCITCFYIFFHIKSMENVLSWSCTLNFTSIQFSVLSKNLQLSWSIVKTVDDRVCSHIKNITELFSNTSFLLPGRDQCINGVRYCPTSMTIWYVLLLQVQICDTEGVDVIRILRVIHSHIVRSR